MTKLVTFLLLLLPLSYLCVYAGTVCYSETSLEYVDWYRGSENTNVIISVPHDGDLKPTNIPDRKQGCYNSRRKTCDYRHDCTSKGGKRYSGKCKPSVHSDANTFRLAMEMRKAITSTTGETPHVIVSRLHRSKMDPNREKDEGVQHDQNAIRAYYMFHGYIQKAHNLVKGPGIQFDIHGYTSHKDNWMEIGYLITSSDLNSNTLNYRESSIRSLAYRIRKRTSFSTLLKGKESLGGLFQNLGYKSVPSPRYPRPKDGTEGKYYRGGYITQRWGSMNGGDIDCIQLELPWYVRDEYAKHAPKLGSAMGYFVSTYYNN